MPGLFRSIIASSGWAGALPFLLIAQAAVTFAAQHFALLAADRSLAALLPLAQPVIGRQLNPQPKHYHTH